MGDRNKSSSGGIPEEERHWKRLLIRENEIDGVKIIRHMTASNSKIPLNSNTPNTWYIVSNFKGEIAYIAEYRNNEIVFSIDMDYNQGIHGHIWKIDDKRERYKLDNSFRVPERCMKLLKGSIEYNHKYFGRPKEGDFDLNIEELLQQKK